MFLKPITLALVLALPLFLAPDSLRAASVGNAITSSTPKSTDYSAGEAAAMDGNFEVAIGHFTKAVNADPTNADAYNMLGFSHRKLDNVDLAFKNYNAALEIDPSHLGANEYIGELYLEIGDLASAEKHLKVLDKACFFGCEAYTDLKTAIKQYKTKQGG